VFWQQVLRQHPQKQRGPSMDDLSLARPKPLERRPISSW